MNNLTGKKVVWAALALVLFLAIMVFFYASSRRMDQREADISPVVTVAPTEQPPGEAQTMPPYISPAFLEEDDDWPLSERLFGQLSGQSPGRSPSPVKSMEEARKITGNAAAAAWQYYQNYHQQAEYVTRNGFLFEMPSQSYITAEILEGLEGFDPQYAAEDVMILFIRNEDAQPWFSVDNTEPSAFVICAAYAIADGYCLSYADQTALAPSDAIEDLLARYSSVHGPIARVSSADGAYMSVLSAIEERAGPVDVRYMEGDEKYISAVVSVRSNPLDVRELILERSVDGYQIKIDQIETFERKFAAINQAAPDLNLRMVPPYNLAADLKYLKSDFSSLVGSIRQSGTIAEEDAPVFISGDDEFVYMEFISGERLLAHCGEAAAEKMEWKIYPVLSYDDAYIRMKELSRFSPPPYFLIKQG